MKLDPRIIEGKRPLTCFDIEEAKQFVGKKGYFSDYLNVYTNLCNMQEGVLESFDEHHDEAFVETCAKWEFFLPAEWVKEPEYRVLTLNEFLERFKIGEALYIRFKKDGAERVVVFSEYSIPPHKDKGNNTESVCLTGIEHHKSVVCLGMREYYLATLFECYEYFDGKKWQPFGIEVKEKE